MLSLFAVRSSSTITPSLSRDKIEPACLSPWACAALTDRWASQLIPFIFLGRVVECARTSAAFLRARSRLCPHRGDCSSIPGCSKWSESPSTRSIGFSYFFVYQTVGGGGSSSSALSDPACPNGKSIGRINKSNNQWTPGRTRRLATRNDPLAPTDRVLVGKASGWRLFRS